MNDFKTTEEGPLVLCNLVHIDKRAYDVREILRKEFPDNVHAVNVDIVDGRIFATKTFNVVYSSHPESSRVPEKSAQEIASEIIRSWKAMSESTTWDLNGSASPISSAR